MVKLDSEGNILVGNEKIHYKWYRSGRRLTSDSPTVGYHYCLETNYNKELISIDDHGNGLEYAKKVARKRNFKKTKSLKK